MRQPTSGCRSPGDGGATWASHLGGYVINGVSVSRGAIYAATDAGLEVSLDNGRSWTARLGGSFVNGVSADGPIVYVASNEGLSVTRNGGAG
jgi:hypothetical protein